VAFLIKNAVIAAEGILPICQDTGTATIVAWKGEGVRTGADDEAVMSAAIREVWQKHHLRYSQIAPLTMFDEKNTGDNLPAQIDVYAVPGKEYHFLFIAKGGGSSNKTTLIQGARALLNETALEKLLVEQIRALGVAACPPYHLAVVIGGTSPERNLRTLKLATAGWLDDLPVKGTPAGAPFGLAQGRPFRDLEWEERVMKIAGKTGFGAQFGGKHLVLAARVIRLPRHAGSCPISIGVSCCAHRNIRGKITAKGVFLEELEKSPERFLEACRDVPGAFDRVDLDQPMEKILVSLKKYKAGSLVLLNGTLIVARDMAHERFMKSSREGKGLPDYLKKHPVFYAGPSETPPGKIIGSLGPTTAQRMDSYVPELMAQGASLVMLAKGNRSASVAEACRRFGGCYLGTIGGAAALIAQEHVVAAEVIDFADLGMEAVRRIKVKNLPAFVIFDGAGRNAF
ncbi:MAG: FumA C-terminus/TtdB family hydratase beta subunit, partial [Kiritimatiellia bacterium]|nr:FumA C-terminus/TtdB family hydratase beta subunit [Kiritimatiellia bacterium]